jgi:hypothetical protein
VISEKNTKRLARGKENTWRSCENSVDKAQVPENFREIPFIIANWTYQKIWQLLIWQPHHHRQ